MYKTTKQIAKKLSETKNGHMISAKDFKKKFMGDDGK